MHVHMRGNIVLVFLENAIGELKAGPCLRGRQDLAAVRWRPMTALAILLVVERPVRRTFSRAIVEAVGERVETV